jgi:hypothetical protein
LPWLGLVNATRNRTNPVCIASAKKIVANKATVIAMGIAVDIFAANLQKKMSLYKTFVSVFTVTALK